MMISIYAKAVGLVSEALHHLLFPQDTFFSTVMIHTSKSAMLPLDRLTLPSLKGFISMLRAIAKVCPIPAQS